MPFCFNSPYKSSSHLVFRAPAKPTVNFNIFLAQPERAYYIIHNVHNYINITFSPLRRTCPSSPSKRQPCYLTLCDNGSNSITCGKSNFIFLSYKTEIQTFFILNSDENKFFIFQNQN